MITDEMVEKAYRARSDYMRGGPVDDMTWAALRSTTEIASMRAALEAAEADLRADERKSAFDEGMWALGDMIGVDSEWYDRILRPSQEA